MIGPWRNRMFDERGFSLAELLIVMAIIMILSAIGLRSYYAFEVKQRDNERIMKMQLFSQKLESYRAQHGYYVCGDACHSYASTGIYYVVDCSDDESWWYTPLTGDDPKEVSDFLNGGNCCELPANGILTNPPDGNADPAPTSMDDDSRWGLYANGYLDSSEVHDPWGFTSQEDGRTYKFCYASPANGRKEYALFVRLEDPTKGQEDGGFCPDWYEIRTSGYPAYNAWEPSNFGYGC